MRLLDALQQRAVVADGAMGTMLQQVSLSLDDFDGFDGCNEVAAHRLLTSGDRTAADFKVG